MNALSSWDSAVEFVESVVNSASPEVAAQSLIRGGVADLPAAIDVIANIAELVRGAHRAGELGLSLEQFIDTARRVTS